MTFDPFDLPVVVTQWRSVKNPLGTEADTTWGTYLKSRRFRAPEVYASKSALLGWSPVAFEGSKRGKSFALRAYGIALDYEPAYEPIPKDPPPGHVVRIARQGATLSEAAKLWGPYYGLIHTTWSHELAQKKNLSAEPGPRFRVILPTRRPLTPDEYAWMWLWAAARAEAVGHPIDEGTKDISRLWYVPGRAPGGPYETIDLMGEPIDPDPICEAAREAEARAEAEKKAAEATRVVVAAQVRASGGTVTGALLGPAPAGTPSRAAYVQRAFEGAVRKLNDAPFGEKNKLLYGQAYGLGGFVATGELNEDAVGEALFGATMAKGCKAGDIWATIRRGIAKGKEAPRPAPVKATRQTTVSAERSPQAPAPEPVVETEVVYDEPPPDLFVDADEVAPLTPRSPVGPEDEGLDVRAVAREQMKQNWRRDGLPAEGDPLDIRQLTALIELKAELLAEGGGGDDGEPPSEGPPDGSDAPQEPPGPKKRPRSFEAPEIEITTLEREVADQAIEALADSDVLVFTRAGELVHIIEHGAAVEESEDSTGPTSARRGRLDERRKRAAMRLPPGAPIIRGLTIPGVRSLLSHVCRFGRWKWDAKEKDDVFVNAHPPVWCVSDVQSRGNWPDIRPLTAIVECPMLRADGSIIDKPGYDEFTGLFVRPAGGWPVVPERPTLDDAKTATKMLTELVKDFPFENDAHRSGWLAALLTPLCRHAYRGVSPMFVVDANVRGVGKSKLCDMISIIICGRSMARQSESNDEAEEKKQITTILLSGVPMVLFDNLSKPLGSGHLDSLLTGEDWSDRLFGTQNAVTIPNMCAWYSTGNNVALKGDMSRRVQHIRLVSDRENPEDRNDFASEDIIGDTRERRVELLGAALTLVRAFCLARAEPDFEPQKLPRWGSFEEWSKIVRGAIVWVGEPDPGLTRKDLQTFADSQTSALADFLAGWLQLDSIGLGLTASEAVTKLEAEAFYEKGKKTGKHALLLSALGELMRTQDGLPSASALGYRLRALRGRVLGGLYLLGTSAAGGVMRWSVENVRDRPIQVRAESTPTQSGTARP